MVTDVKEATTVLDLGCGTGLVGKFLGERGFLNNVGVDASSGMIKEAENKKVYKELVELFLGAPKTFPERFHGKFDFTAASGILADNHLDCSVFEEMLLALKVGGIAVFTTRTQYLTEYSYGTYMDKLEHEGKWKQVQKDQFFKYDNEEVQGIGRYTKTEMNIFAY